MKKHTAIIIILTLAAVIITGCGKKQKKVYFGATVLEIHDNYILVMPDEEAEERRSSDQIDISTGNLKDAKSTESLKKLRIGDSVKIGYGGYILESYPAQITDAFSLQRVVPADADKKPPVIILSEKEYGFTRKILDPRTYSWFWGNGGVEADAIHPLDPNLKAVPLHISEGESYTITSGFPIENIFYDRWDAEKIGDMEREPAEANVECPENIIELRPDSVYNIRVTFGESDGAQGNSGYYLITAPSEDENGFGESAGDEESGDSENAAENAYDPAIKALLAPSLRNSEKG